MSEVKAPETGHQFPAASPSSFSAPPARTTAFQPSIAVVPAKEAELLAGQTGPAIPHDKSMDAVGNVIDPERVKAAQEERAAYMHGNPPDDQPFGEGRTVGDIRKAQEPEVDRSRRVVEIDDQSGELSGKVRHVTETIES